MDNEAAPPQRGQVAFATRFLSLWHRYRKLLLAYWWIIVITVGASLWIERYILLHTPMSFQSIGRMILNTKLSIPIANLYPTDDLNNFFGTQVELMQSGTVIGRVYERLKSQKPPLHAVPVDIRVTLSPKASIFNLYATGRDPEYVQAYLEATMEEYISLKRELLTKASTATKTGLQEERERVAEDLEKAKAAYMAYQASNSVVFLQPSGGNNAADYLASLNRKLTEHKSELQLLKTLTLDENLERQQGVFSSPDNAQPNSGALENPSSSNPAARQNSTSSPPANSGPLADRRANQLPETPPTLGTFEMSYLQAKQRIVMLEAARDDMSQVLRPKHPDMIELNGEIASQKKLLEIFKDQSQEQLKNRQRSVEVEIKELEKQIVEFELKASEVSKKLSDFEQLKEKYNRLQGIYDQLQATLQTLDLDKGVGQDSVGIFEPAIPAFPTPLQGVKHMAIAGVMGLVLGVGILFLINQFDDRPNSLTELEDRFHEPVLGHIPLVKPKRRKEAVPLIQAEDDRHALLEAYANLRSALIFKDSPENHSRSIVVTSAVPGDGKSSVCANLAITLAHSGARVLLVDADLRRGVMHKHFSVPERPGLADVLGQKCDWAKAVVPTSVPNLHLLPRGEPVRRPASLFVSQTDKLLKQMEGHYDYYLFDSAPVMVADDVSSLAPHVGSLIMVIRAGSTSGRVAKAALDLLYLRNVNVIGLVFNAVTRHTGAYYYDRYHEYFPEVAAK